MPIMIKIKKKELWLVSKISFISDALANTILSINFILVS